LVCLTVALGAVSFPSPAGAATLTEFSIPTVGGSPGDIARGPDGAQWFTETAGGGTAPFRAVISRITTAGRITPFSLAEAFGLFGISSGPDRALWFTEFDRVGRISTAGAVTTFPLPNFSPPPGVWKIAAGPDGALWFTENGFMGTPGGTALYGKVGRITTAGSIKEFPAPFALEIAPGPDGALWFTGAGQVGDAVVGTIDRITTAGTITQFPLPDSAASPNDIVAGPDGALWFTDRSCPYSPATGTVCAGKIGRITTAGTVTEFPLPANSRPEGIVAGPDGAVWFTDERCTYPQTGELCTGARVGRITTAGMIKEYPLPIPTAGAGAIAGGSDGALWFTETRANKIGRMTTDLMVGKGAVSGGGKVGSYAYVLSCSASADGALAPRLEVDLDGQRFHLTSGTGVQCSDDPAVKTPAAGFDTQTGTGVGTLTSGGPGTVAWKFVDGGVGGGSDSVQLTIRNARGALVFQGSAAPPAKFPGSDQATGINTAR
jgi:virginiamycin B lyase